MKYRFDKERGEVVEKREPEPTALLPFEFAEGSIYVAFHENVRRSIANMFAGRPIDEGWIPPQVIGGAP